MFEYQRMNRDFDKKKPSFYEQQKHQDQDSDISDDDFGDIDENVIRPSE